MKTNNRTQRQVAVAVLAAVILWACGGSTGAEPTGTTGGDATVPAGTEPETPATTTPEGTDTPAPTGSQEPDETFPSGDGEPIRIGSSAFTGFAAVEMLPEIAEERGFTVELVDFPSSSERGQGLLAGDADLAVLGWTQILSLAGSGEPVVAVANIFEKGRTVVVPADSDYQEFADLAGASIAVSLGSMVELDLYTELEMAGMTLDDIEMVQLGFSDMPIALAQGDIDAFLGSEPQSSIAISEGYARLLKYPYDGPYGAINAGLATTQSFIEERPEALRAVMSAFVEANRRLAEPGVLTQVAAEMFEVDTEVAEMALDNLELTYEIADATRTQVAALGEALVAAGQIDQAPDVNIVINTDVLDELTSS